MRGISQHDRSLLRGLAAQVAEVAALPVQQESIERWRRLNRLERVKPMIWINEIPWHETDVNGELTIRTEDAWCQVQEERLRRTLYLWRHMRGDMVVEPIFHCPLVIHDTGFGIDEEVDIARTDNASTIYSRGFHLQIQDEGDLEKIKTPVVTYDAAATERDEATLQDLFGDLLTIQRRGAPGFWFAPWDELIRWWGVEQAMLDLVLKPELVHQAMDRLVNAYLSRLDQYEEQNLLSLNNDNERIGSGGIGYTDELPQPDYDPQQVRPLDLWGSATAQIFSDVSPKMHEEFALRYERRWLDRFGLTYYGCCEPLHLKLDMLRSVPNLRKISMSPWIDVDVAVQNIGTDYVFSLKPSPAILAQDVWHPERARQDLVDVLEKTRGCIVEVILKDLSTVRYKPQRLWEWAAMAEKVTAQFA